MIISSTKENQTSHTVWFDEFIAAIRTHQLQLETDTATESLKNTYSILMNGSQDDMAHYNKISANMHFIKSMVLEYLRLIAARMPTRLAFDMDDSEVLIWAQIEDNDEDHENFLLLAEAEINAKFHSFGYDLTSTIVENGDRLEIPNHYNSLK